MKTITQVLHEFEQAGIEAEQHNHLLIRQANVLMAVSFLVMAAVIGFAAYIDLY